MPQPQGGYLAQLNTGSLYIGRLSPPANLNAGAVSPVGGSQPHDNRMPYLAITFILSLFGVFPTQT